MLTLPQELYLLALHEEKGRVPAALSTSLHYGLGGAILAELILQGRVGLDDDRKAVVVNNTMFGEDDLLNEALERIQASGRHHKTTYWVSTFSDNIRKLEKRLANGLVDRGVLRKEEKRFLGVMPYEAYPAQDASARFWIKQHLRSVVLGGEAADAHTATLLSLVCACDMLERVFTRDELKAARRKIETLTSGEVIGDAVQQAIETIEAATMAAIMAATSS
jgi:Golgi phosphoprotein 3